MLFVCHDLKSHLGSFNENLLINGIPDSPEANLEHYDEWGTENTYVHYATGWTMAGNTPFKRWKRNVFNGGIADPFIVSWPKGIGARGEVRTQYSHAIDLVPTVLDTLGSEPPLMLKGVPQEEITGTSLAATFESAEAEEVRLTQYYEMYGSRAIYNEGWKAVTYHRIPGIPADGPGDTNLPFVKDQWELYDLTRDFSECHDLAAENPDKLQELIGLWFAEAGKNNVFPLHSHQMKGQRPKPYPARDLYVYYPGSSRIDNEAAVNVRMRPYSVVAHAVIPEGGAEGVLIAQAVTGAPWLDVSEVRLVVNGERRPPLAIEGADGRTIKFRDSVRVDMPRDGWIAVEVRGARPLYPLIQQRSGDGSPQEAALPYALTMFMLVPVLTTTYILRRFGCKRFVSAWDGPRLPLIFSAILGVVAYLLALFAYTIAPLSYSGASVR